jgi:bifunctional DNA-binding transcriptional regulator/antitoxin component of YhaV-PrlF toxin-antitoxin module
MDHFNIKERDAMCLEFHEFDRRIIHEKYDKVVRRFENERNLPGAKTEPDWIQQL